MYQESQFLAAKDLLAQLIACPSMSKEEQGTAQILVDFFMAQGIQPHLLGNNVWATNLHFDASKPTILLNSHHDTVKANASWTFDPFKTTEQEGN